MEFKINGMKWRIKEKSLKELLDNYNEANTQKATYLYGSSLLDKHEIWLNKDNCNDQKLMTLAHELTHCWLWYSALSYLPNYSEETVCEIVSNCYKFIDEIVEKYRQCLKEGKESNE